MSELFALATGRFSDAEALIDQTLALGARAQRDAAVGVQGVHRYTLCDFRDAPGEAEDTLHELARAYPARPLFRCMVAHLHARLGRHDEARRLLAELTANGCAAVPFDGEWLYALSYLAEAAALTGDASSAAILAERIEPWAALNVVDVGEGIRGSAARYTGLLAATLERWDDAERHFCAAAEANRRMGLRPWLAHTLHDHARMLVARDALGDRERAEELLGAAMAEYRALGLDRWAATAAREGTRR